MYVYVCMRAHCPLRRLYLFSFFGGKIEPNGWLSTEVQ